MRNLSHLEQYRRRDKEMQLYEAQGDDYNGIFKVFVKGKSFFVVASNGGGWDHVSVSPGTNRKNGIPTWEEMCAIKDMFFEKEETVVQYHPAESNYINVREDCLHLWRPNTTELPLPPKQFV